MFSFIKSLFAPKGTKPKHSELSNPTQCERPKRKTKDTENLRFVLGCFIYRQSVHGPMSTRKFIKLEPDISSHGQRLSQLKELGYLTAEKQDTEYGKRYVWSYTEKGFNFLYKN